MNSYIENKNIGKCIVFTFLTCGLYGLFWFAGIINSICDLKNQKRTGATDILLALLTCGLYGIYLYYRIGDDIETIRRQRGLERRDSGVLYLILGLIGLSLVDLILAQDTLNKLC